MREAVVIEPTAPGPAPCRLHYLGPEPCRVRRYQFRPFRVRRQLAHSRSPGGNRRRTDQDIDDVSPRTLGASMSTGFDTCWSSGTQERAVDPAWPWMTINVKLDSTGPEGLWTDGTTRASGTRDRQGLDAPDAAPSPRDTLTDHAANRPAEVFTVDDATASS